MTFPQMVEEELSRVRRKVKPFNSHHEALGVLWEEFSEYREEVFRKERKRDQENMLRELVQISGICQRIAEDLLPSFLVVEEAGPVS